MTAIEIKEEYALKMNNAESMMEKNLLNAEMKHKLKLVNAGEETDYTKRASESDFECIGCSA
jgi:hypothetical protein